MSRSISILPDSVEQIPLLPSPQIMAVGTTTQLLPPRPSSPSPNPGEPPLSRGATGETCKTLNPESPDAAQPMEVETTAHLHYSRIELEALRPADPASHRRLWGELHDCLVPDLIRAALAPQPARRRYSRREMEALRYVDAEKQRRLWEEVYANLGEAGAREYDGVWAVQGQKPKRTRKAVYAFSGEVAAETTSACLDVPDLSDFGYATTLDYQKGATTVEKECEEDSTTNNDDSSSDEYDCIRRPAFMVEGEPDFESGAPVDGLEYLRRVRWEAARVPKVKVAKLNLSIIQNEQTPYMPNIPEIAKCPPDLLPSKSWVATFLADFTERRQAFIQLESSSDPSSFTIRKDNSHEESSKTIPTMSTILSMDAVTRGSTLQKRIRALEAASSLSREDCVWLFALCVVVDTPFNAEMSASLRSLLRKCSSLLAGKSEPDDEVAMLSILVTIAGKYFGQSET